MRLACASWGVVCLTLGCSGCDSGQNAAPANAAGSSSGGGGSSAVGGGGMSSGGVASQAGSATGGTGQGQSGSATGGVTAGGAGGAGGAPSGGVGGATSGGSGGGDSKAFVCPAGPFAAPAAMGAPKRVEGVPPSDAFNNNGNDSTNIEGLVWIGDALYVSEINSGKGTATVPPPSRVLKITANDQVSIAIPPDSGSNGLAINAAGELFGALHKDGSISKLSLSGGAAVPVVSTFMGARFDSPNDLTFHTNGTLYFTDPSWQSPTPRPQADTRAYRVPPGGEPQVIEVLDQPNGITLSVKQDFLYIGGNQLKRYPVMADGSLGAGTTFHGSGTTTDGMVVDCADNVYAAGASCNDGCAGKGATVFSPAGAILTTIPTEALEGVTNVAFGGADHKTLYISGQGPGTQKGLFKVQMNVPGYPY
ncbi:MAG TPA: SMP-30/gluconolactonase/LRE family protein [Polyangiaceae bacterium]